MSTRYLAVGLGIGLSAVAVFGTQTTVDGVLTIDGEVVAVTAESELGGAATIEFRNGGGVTFNGNVSALAKTYRIADSETRTGLAATGIVEVAAGIQVAGSAERLIKNSLGHTFVKRGAGTLTMSGEGTGFSSQTRWIIESGSFHQSGANLFGSYSTPDTNLVIDVREGAVYKMTSDAHNPMSRLELTGATFDVNNAGGGTFWGNTAFRGGVHVHACATPSQIIIGKHVHLQHVDRYSAFVIESNATLYVDGTLTNGRGNPTTAEAENTLIVQGGGDLYLRGENSWTGGTIIEDGTTIHVTTPTSLGTGAITLKGDATIEVAQGCRFVCPPLAVEGMNTLTFTGAGAVTLPTTVPEGLTIVNDTEGKDSVPVDAGGVLTLMGGPQIIDVPTGKTLTLTGFREVVSGASATADIVKEGGGTLVLPNADNASSFQRLFVRAGTVQIAAANNLGGGNVTLTGGTLAFSASVSFPRTSPRVTVSGAGAFDVPEGCTVSMCTNTFWSAGATFTKKGAGRVTFGDSHWEGFGQVNADTRWICDQGSMSISGDPFGGHSSSPVATIEAHEGTTLYAGGHSPVGRVILRGATMRYDGNQLQGSDMAAALEEPCAMWSGFALNGLVQVLPSATPSVICATRTYLAHATNETTFEVQEGAVLRIEGRLSEGRGTTSSQPRANGFAKRGGGELVLAGALDCTLPVSVEEGTLTFERQSDLADTTPLFVAPNARVRLADGTTLGSPVNASPSCLSAADVWMDATRCAARHGDAVARVRNFGRAGGFFTKVNANAPVFTTNAINGLSALYCNGGAALVLDAYTNHTSTMTAFMVAKWTSWNNNDGVGGYGRWGGGLSISRYAATENDNATAYSFHTETSDSIHYTSFSAPSIASVRLENKNREVGTPYIDAFEFNGSKLTARQYVRDDVADVTLSAGQAGSFNVDRVALGGRLRGAGQVQYGGTLNGTNDRMYIGDIGELIVFSRVLTADETAVINAYLKRKWFGSTVEMPANPFTDIGAAPTTVDVPSGAAAFAGELDAQGVNTADVVLSKTGAGTLALRAKLMGSGAVQAAEGALDLSDTKVASRVDVWMDAADAATVTLNDAGRATSVLNKGRAGGAFGTCPGRWSSVVPYPGYEQEAINGRPALTFDTNAGLSLAAYTNKLERRELHIYAVLQRTSYDDVGGKGKWGGPFSLYGSEQSGDDQTTTGSFQITETKNATDATARHLSVYCGSGGRAVDVRAGGLDEPYLFVTHQEGWGYWFAYEWADTATSAVNIYAQGSTCPAVIDRVNLGGRSTTAGALQWQAKDHKDNRTWHGRIGELIVVTRKLSTTDEAALLAYLRRKWFGKGEGSATPPAFLSGDYGAPNLATAGLVLEDGTGVSSSGPTLALASLTAGDGVTWTRDAAADPAGFAFFDVAGALALGANQTLNLVTAPSASAKLIGGAWTGELAPWTVTGDKASTTKVTARADGVWVGRATGAVLYLR